MVIREMLLAVASRRNEKLQISGFQNISAAAECGLQWGMGRVGVAWLRYDGRLKGSVDGEFSGEI